MAQPPELDALAKTIVTHVTSVDPLDDDRAGQLQMVVFGNGNFATHSLPDRGVLTIGRSGSCDIAIADESISRRHAILNIATPLTIEDLGSANGTLVRSSKLKLGKPSTISIGEMIGLGKASMILQRKIAPIRARRIIWSHEDFDARLAEECAHEQRTGAAFAVLHLEADARAGASFVEDTVSEIVRDSDVVGRYGSHKYQLLLPSTSPSEAGEAMTRIHHELAQRGMRWGIAITCCPRDGRNPYKLAARPIETQREPIESDEIIVVDPQMESLHRMLDLVARAQISVLLLGETGVGKEVFARAVHARSTRATGPFVEVNCAALTETLLESELFGHERGAFTNATATKVGLIEAADTGTLFLDEVGDMPLGTQAKLLRVLEDSQIRRVGAVKSRGVDVRFVAATNSDLEQKVETGEFRRDLYFRLNGLSLVIPPLRERLAEIEPLARAFIQRARSKAKLTPAAIAWMRTYDWPGNVRELRNTMERAVLLADGGDIYPEHLPTTKMATRAARPTIDPSQRGSAAEQQLIIQALDRTNGNQTAAARLLGISRRTLVNRLNEYEQVHRPRKHKPKK